MSVIKRVGMLLLLILGLVLAVLLYVTMTHDGMQRLFSLGQSTVTGELVVGNSTGTLVGPASFEDISFVNETEASVSIDFAEFDWHPTSLLRRTLRVDILKLQGIDIHLPPPSEVEAESPPFQLRDLALPIGVDIKSVHVSDLNIYPHSATEPFVIDSIKLSAAGENSSLRLIDLQVESPQLQGVLSGTLDTSGDWPVNLMPEWQFTHDQFGEFSGSGALKGDIKSLDVSHQIIGPGATQPLSADVDMQIKDVTAELSWSGDIKVNTDDLGVFSPAANGIPLMVDAVTSGSLQNYVVKGTLQTRHPVTGEATSDFDIQVDLQKINLNQVVLSFEDSPGTLLAQGSLALADLQSDVKINWKELRWPLSQAEALITQSPAGVLKITGVPDNLHILADSQVSQPGVGEIGVAADVVVNSSMIEINTLRLDTGRVEPAIEVNGKVDLLRSDVAINGKLRQLSWPLIVRQSDALAHIAAGDFSVNGPLERYNIDAQLQIEGAQIPTGTWQLTALGDQQQLTDIMLRGETLAGEITGTGEAAWAPQPGWLLKLVSDGLNPAEKWPGLQGSIGFTVSSTGAIDSNGLQAQTEIMEVNGSYREQPLSGAGAISIARRITTISQFELTAGAASVSANGTAGDTLDLQWHLNAPSIGTLVPQADGNIQVTGKVSGLAAAPESEFSIAIDNLNTDSLQVASGSGSGVVDMSGVSTSSVKLDLNNLTAGGQTVRKLNVSGQGTPQDHRAVITAVSDAGDLTVSASGGISSGTWQGTLEQLDLADTEFGNWALHQPVLIKAGTDGVNASGLCLNSKPGQVCIDTLWDSQKGVRSSVEISSLDTLQFKKYLPPEITLDASVNGTLDLQLKPASAPDVQGEFTIPGGKLDYLDAGEPRSATLGTNRIEFEYANDNLQSSVDLHLGEIGTVTSQTNINDLSGARLLSGSVTTDLKDLAVFSAFAPGLDSFKGSLNASMQLAGSVDAPKVIGDSDLDSLVLEVPSVAMKLIDGKIVARSDGKGGLKLSGSAASGDGELKIEGSLNPANQDIDITVKGENFQVANAKNQRLLISPDLRVVKKGDAITVTGKVHVPSAYYQAGAEASLVKESSDVVIVNGSEQSQDEAAASQMTIKVEVTLGDDIRVKAGQFNGALAGTVTVEQVPGGVPTGVGAIEVLNGDFVVYGQKLTMENGRILFGGGPVANPALEFDVAREVPAYEVKAGARVRGTAQAPLLQLQSEPPQTDANTVSYIILGRPLGSEGVSYTLGKYLTPDLYVSYGIDLISKAETYNLRYSISELLSLIAAKSDDVSSADFIYTFER